LPEPVGATTSACSPARIADHAPAWAGVGSANAPVNHARVGAEKAREGVGHLAAHPDIVVAPADISAGLGPWQADPVRYSEFWELVDDVFGRLGRTLARDQVVGALDDRTAVQALDAGEDPAAVWRALCDAMEVPTAQRWGRDRPRRRR